VDVRKTIDELKSSLAHSLAEETLLDTVTDGLATLRQSFASQKSSFDLSDIEFLKSLTTISTQLQEFIELKEELLDVGGLKHYTALMNRLVDLKEELAAFPISRRIRKEMRDLSEKLPAIREQDNANRQFRSDARILDLQQDPPRCSRNHTMAIREGRYGYFWGCSQYPFCEETAHVAPEQKLALYF